jgi:hypothetical protein
MLSADIQGTGKWELVYSIDHTKPTGDLKIQLDIPTLFNSPFVLAGAICFQAKPTWYFGGNLIQYAQNIQIDDRVVYPGQGQPSQIADIASRRLRLNYIQLVQFSPLVPQYQLFFDAPPWIKSINLDLWEYKGTVEDAAVAALAPQIETIKVDLVRIETILNRQ